MLQLLQTGKVLYALAAICALGVISKLVTSSLYKRLIKETGNMALTKNKNLKTLKQKTENMFLINHGIRNTTAYIEKQIYGFRFMKISLDNWDNLSMQTMILSFLVGGVAAFGAYWFRCDSYYIVLYGAVGILAGLFMVLVDNGANIASKRQQLSDCLVDYVENSPHFYKNVDKQTDSMEPDRKGSIPALAVSKPRIRDIRREGRKGGKGLDEIAAGEEEDMLSGSRGTERENRFHIEKEKSSKADSPQEKGAKAQSDRQGGRFSVLSRKKDGRQEQVMQPAEAETARNEMARGDAARKNVQPEEDELAGSIERLRESLEQIAASREGTRREFAKPQEKGHAERTKKELRPEELKLLGEILQEYFS